MAAGSGTGPTNDVPEGVEVTTARQRHRAGLWPGAGHNSCGRRGRRQQEASGLMRGIIHAADAADGSKRPLAWCGA